MNSKMLIQQDFNTQVEHGSFLKDLFQPLFDRFAQRAEHKNEWMELDNKDLNFFDNENELEEYIISFRQ